jgi:hypothetical protein
LIGWLAALGTSLILSGVIAAVVSTILGSLGFGGVSEAGTLGLLGVLVTLFLAFLIGGYAAGRMAGREGSKHGLLVALLALIIMLILALLGGAAGFNLIENLRGVTLPGIPSEVSQQGLGTVLTLGGVLALCSSRSSLEPSEGLGEPKPAAGDRKGKATSPQVPIKSCAPYSETSKRARRRACSRLRVARWCFFFSFNALRVYALPTKQT